MSVIFNVHYHKSVFRLSERARKEQKLLVDSYNVESEKFVLVGAKITKGTRDGAQAFGPKHANTML